MLILFKQCQPPAVIKLPAPADALCVSCAEGVEGERQQVHPGLDRLFQIFLLQQLVLVRLLYPVHARHLPDPAGVECSLQPCEPVMDGIDLVQQHRAPPDLFLQLQLRGVDGIHHPLRRRPVNQLSHIVQRNLHAPVPAARQQIPGIQIIEITVIVTAVLLRPDNIMLLI
ncbi:hypothetical protein D3C80_1615550 [compost metagenome]